MKSSHTKATKKSRATLWTDCARVILCGLGCVALCLVIIGFLDEEHDYPLAGLIIGGIIGLAFVAVGLFAKPRTVEKAAEGLNL
ncbi:MAG: hypothetical protein U1F83_01200 [Verrucomicrobiota bacterium]